MAGRRSALMSPVLQVEGRGLRPSAPVTFDRELRPIDVINLTCEKRKSSRNIAYTGLFPIILFSDYRAICS